MSQNSSTKVVSLRNIPGDVTDVQVALMGLQFGEVINMLYIKAKGQVSHSRLHFFSEISSV